MYIKVHYVLWVISFDYICCNEGMDEEFVLRCLISWFFFGTFNSLYFLRFRVTSRCFTDIWAVLDVCYVVLITDTFVRYLTSNQRRKSICDTSITNTEIVSKDLTNACFCYNFNLRPLAPNPCKRDGLYCINA